MLSVAGHLTIFLTRTRGPFWSIRPARILWVAVLGTQILATCIALFGFFMARLDWRWVLLVWVYAAVWALVSDRAKLIAYRILDPPKPDAPSDLTPLIAKRAFELYKAEGSHDGHAVEDWKKAEREIEKKEVRK
jgi:H+-transporting ATPase